MRYGGIISAFWLKSTMLALMVLDHLYSFLFPAQLVPAHYLARVVAPVFAFLMAQGMVHTRDRTRYLLRLWSFGALMAAVNIILSLLTGVNIPNNIFLSLAVAASLIFCLDNIKNAANRFFWFAAAGGMAFASFFCEGAYLVPLMGLIFYYLRRTPALMYGVFVFSTGLPYFASYFLSGRLEAQFYMIFSVIPLMLYNGRRGPDTLFAKYFFYLFYPVHIWAIVLIKAFFFS